MTAASIGAGRGGGYARYLEGKTIAPEQGDYYLTLDGELTEAPGRWLSDPQTLVRLGIDPDAPVHRGGGIDVTFSVRSRCRWCGRWGIRSSASRSRPHTRGPSSARWSI